MATETEKFLYGATLLGHTVEGENYASDWWHWEQRPGRIAGGATSQTAAGHWSRYQDDTKLASTLGLNCLLVSIEWSRIEPKRGEFDPDALDHYVHVLQSMNKNDITPIVALQAITLPAWFAEAGGWAQKNAEDIFQAYAQKVVPALSRYCQYWIPLYRNFDSLTLGSIHGAWPPGRRSVRVWEDVLWRTTSAFELVQNMIWDNDHEAHIGISMNPPDVLPYDEESPWDYRTARKLNTIESGGFYADPDEEQEQFDDVDATAHSLSAQFHVVTLPGRRWGRFAPTAIRRGFMQFVDENGVDADTRCRQPDPAQLAAIFNSNLYKTTPTLFIGGGHSFANDRLRCEYLLDHIEAIQSYKSSGAHVLGYIHESYLDGFEWDRGYSTRRGLVHVDWETLARTPNKSAYLLGDIARQGEITSSAVQKYCPDWQSKLEVAL